MVGTVHLRLAHVHDVPPIMQLVRRAVPLMRAGGNLQWDDTYPNAAVFLHDVELAQLWIAEAKGIAADGTTEAEGTAAARVKLAGVAALTTDQSPEYALVGWDISEPAIVVHRLVVDPDARGRGVGRALMQQAETVARQRGIAVLRVDTNTENAATRKLFPQLGYTLAGEIPLHFRPGLRFLCYEKRL